MGLGQGYFRRAACVFLTRGQNWELLCKYPSWPATHGWAGCSLQKDTWLRNQEDWNSALTQCVLIWWWHLFLKQNHLSSNSHKEALGHPLILGYVLPHILHNHFQLVFNTFIRSFIYHLLLPGHLVYMGIRLQNNHSPVLAKSVVCWGGQVIERGVTQQCEKCSSGRECRKLGNTGERHSTQTWGSGDLIHGGGHIKGRGGNRGCVAALGAIWNQERPTITGEFEVVQLI